MENENIEKTITRKIQKTQERINNKYNSYLEEENLSEDLNNWFSSLDINSKLQIYLSIQEDKNLSK